MEIQRKWGTFPSSEIPCPQPSAERVVHGKPFLPCACESLSALLASIKVRGFIWIPVQSTLRSRGISLNSSCPSSWASSGLFCDMDTQQDRCSQERLAALCLSFWLSVLGGLFSKRALSWVPLLFSAGFAIQGSETNCRGMGCVFVCIYGKGVEWECNGMRLCSLRRRVLANSDCKENAAHGLQGEQK